MDDLDHWYLDNRRPDPYPLTKVDFFHAKHRAMKQANAVATAKGLPAPRSVASYIDMAAVRNFDHYDDIGVPPNDPVARDLVRREHIEAIEAEHQAGIAEKVLQNREEAFENRKQARAEELSRGEAFRAKQQLQRAKAREETREQVREAFRWQPREGTISAPMHAPAIHVPRAKKRKQAVAKEDVEDKEKQVFRRSGKENKKAVRAWMSTSEQMLPIEYNEPEVSPSKGRKRRMVVDSDENEDEEMTSPPPMDTSATDD